jgi:HEAT repeat protein
MERVTFPAPEVQKALEKFELCKLDVDAAADRELCARLQRGGGVPTFVALGVDGAELSRWVGAFGADDFVAKLAEARDDTAARLLAAGDDHGARAEIHAARGDLEPTLGELAALTAGGGADAAAVTERVSWLLCTTLQDQQRWPDLERAARHYLERCIDGAHADDARVARGLATFAQTGTTTPELQARVDRLVKLLGEPSPKRSLYDRLWRSLGAPNEASEQAQDEALGEWVDRVNSTNDKLVRLGRAALPALHAALRDGSDDTAGQVATVIGRIRDPGSHAFLCELLDHAKLDEARRTQVVRSLGLYKDAADLPRMVALASSDAAPELRSAAVYAIRCELSEGTTDCAIADALSDALESHDPELREDTLQAMFKVHAPLALDRLLDAMDDERVIFEDCRICDNALWIFTNQIGRNVVGRDDTVMVRCTPAVTAYLSQWYADVKTHLRWDATQAHWIDDREVVMPAERALRAAEK